MPSPTPIPTLEPLTLPINFPAQTITGGISNGYMGGYQNVTLNIPAQTVTLNLGDIITNVLDSFRQMLDNLDYYLPWLVVALSLIAIFTICKREVRL